MLGHFRDENHMNSPCSSSLRPIRLPVRRLILSQLFAASQQTPQIAPVYLRSNINRPYASHILFISPHVIRDFYKNPAFRNHVFLVIYGRCVWEGCERSLILRSRYRSGTGGGTSKSGQRRSAVIVASCGVFRFGGKFRHRRLDIYMYLDHHIFESPNRTKTPTTSRTNTKKNELHQE